ncbi:hypothetical protein EDD85DRAFT_797389 [Armillaria nabsnona]|nr:hypothetical protein EDD85DRAFT_797389 [Armillaria nabsnona]
MHAFIAFPDHSTSLLSHNKSWRYLQEIGTNDHASKRIDQGTSARKLNLRKRRQTQLNARTQGSNAEFSWPAYLWCLPSSESEVEDEGTVRMHIGVQKTGTEETARRVI